VDPQSLRASTRWHHLYCPDWDDAPEQYVASGVVAWGRSKRLGFFQDGPVKAYIGVQHVDPARGGWNVFDNPTARFFASLFVGGRVITLRTFATLGESLLWLAANAGPLVAGDDREQQSTEHE
jgi:hypothetical protein